MIYKVVFENNSVRYVTADSVDTYNRILTFYNNEEVIADSRHEPWAPIGQATTRPVLTTAFRMKWLSVEVVDEIPFTSTQTGDTGEDI